LANASASLDGVSRALHARLVALPSRGKQGKVVGITFDDGYLENLDNALPILRVNGFTATCYAVSSMIGGTKLWDKDKVEENP
jgi:peptidoglycan/xylan/chitin deacetylase (PgdA/CDA1 family)